MHGQQYTFYLDPHFDGAHLATPRWKQINDKEKCDVIIIDNEEPPEWLHSYLHQHPLTPAVFIGEGLIHHEFVIPELTVGSLQHQLHNIEKLLDRKTELPERVIEAASTDPYVAAGAYAWLRDGKVQVNLSNVWPKGYGYDLRDTNSDAETILETMTTSGYLARDFAEAAHPCPDCQSIQVLLRDSCTKCGSVKIDEQPILHHFKCSYQGHESAFLDAAGQYHCPKCNDPLKHFGIDYDKPGLINVCRNCDHESHETKINGRCLSCSHNFHLEETERQEINNYTLTKEGIHALFQGTYNVYDPKSIMGSHIKMLDPEHLYTIAKKMAAIEQRHGFRTLMIELSFEDIEKSNAKLSDKVKLLTEVGKELAKIIRPTDAIAYNLGKFILLMPGNEEKTAKIICDRLSKTIQSIFADESLKQPNFKCYSVTEAFPEGSDQKGHRS